jgi:uncharacterized protein (DUF2147 family)
MRLISLFMAAVVLSFACAAPVLAADGIVGTWQTEPDRKDLTSHIQITPCGANFCGTILRAFDPAGNEVMTKNIGKRLFWDMQAVGDGTYTGGTVYVPLIEKTTTNVKLTLNGSSLKVRGRVGPISATQNWTRLR